MANNLDMVIRMDPLNGRMMKNVLNIFKRESDEIRKRHDHINDIINHLMLLGRKILYELCRETESLKKHESELRVKRYRDDNAEYSKLMEEFIRCKRKRLKKLGSFIKKEVISETQKLVRADLRRKKPARDISALHFYRNITEEEVQRFKTTLDKFRQEVLLINAIYEDKLSLKHDSSSGEVKEVVHKLLKKFPSLGEGLIYTHVQSYFIRLKHTHIDELNFRFCNHLKNCQFIKAETKLSDDLKLLYRDPEFIRFSSLPHFSICDGVKLYKQYLKGQEVGAEGSVHGISHLQFDYDEKIKQNRDTAINLCNMKLYEHFRGDRMWDLAIRVELENYCMDNDLKIEMVKLAGFDVKTKIGARSSSAETSGHSCR